MPRSSRSASTPCDIRKSPSRCIHQLKAGGYKVVHLVPRAPVTTVPKYDEMLMQQDKLSVNT
jgi:hypothetical protein